MTSRDVQRKEVEDVVGFFLVQFHDARGKPTEIN